ncbi:hypothetical protein J31TS3_39020 [Paenibacillus lactis]|nr:hypothetical protein J31TS3_39020 [Paenibacillus lactis]
MTISWTSHCFMKRRKKLELWIRGPGVTVAGRCFGADWDMLFLPLEKYSQGACEHPCDTR